MIIGPWAKSFPSSLWGSDGATLEDENWTVRDFQTPLLTVRRDAVIHNTAVMAAWAQQNGVELSPHGKTSMSPYLWQQMLDAGAWGLTVATAWQAQVAVAAGVPRVMIANEVTNPVSLEWIAAERQQQIYLWVDSIEALRAIERSHPSRPLSVLLDLGSAGGRTGVRDMTVAAELARVIAESDAVRLVGVAGYEGALAHGRDGQDIAIVRRYCESMAELFIRIAPLFQVSDPLITAAGSTYFDVVAEVLTSALPDARVILRPGAYQLHDRGFYERVSPFGKDSTGPQLRAAVDGWASVVSRPEPELILLDCGRRDFAADIDLPQIDPLDPRLGGDAHALEINDQHLFIKVPSNSVLGVGDLVRLDLSHPCTSMDKWRAIPMLEGSSPQPSSGDRVVGVIETWF